MDRGIRAARAQNAEELALALKEAKDLNANAVKHGLITPVQSKEQLRRTEVIFEGGVKLGQLEQLVEHTGWRNAEANLQEWSLSSPPKNWTQDEWDNFINDSQTAMNKMRERINRSEREGTENYKQLSRANLLESLISGGGNIPTYDPTVSKAINERWENLVLPSWSQMPPGEQRNRFMADQLIAMQKMPSKFKDFVGSIAASGDPAAVGDLVQVWDRVLDQRESMLASIEGKPSLILTNLRNVLQAKGSIDEADVKSAMDRFYYKPGVYDANLARHSENLKQANLDGFVNDAIADMGYSGLFQDDAKATGQFRADYELLMRKALGENAEWDEAHAAVVTQLQGTWGRTYSDPAFPEGKMTRFSPESRSGMSSEALNKYKNEYIAKHAPDLYKEHGADAFLLVADGITTNMEGIPSYSVELRTDKTLPDKTIQVRTKAGMLRFIPNPMFDPEIQAAQAQRERLDNQVDAFQAIKLRFERDLAGILAEGFQNPIDKDYEMFVQSSDMMFNFLEELERDPSITTTTKRRIRGQNFDITVVDKKRMKEFKDQLTELRESIVDEWTKKNVPADKLPERLRGTPKTLHKRYRGGARGRPTGEPPL